MTDSNSALLVVGPSWVGDMVMAQSLFIRLKQNDPKCRIDALAPAWTLPLVDHMPEVECGIEIPLPRGALGIGARYRLGQELRARHYDQAILLPNSLKSALIPFFARIPRRTGFLGEMRWGLLNDVRHLDKSVLTQTVQRFVALASSTTTMTEAPECPNPRLHVDASEIDGVRAKFALEDLPNSVLGLCPGAEYGPAKRWPEAYFARLAGEKIRQGTAVWLFGSAKDRAICERINQAAGGNCRNFAGQTSLNEAIALLALTDQIVTNDSGLMHVAAALGKKVIALYGSSDPKFTPPMTAQARILTLGLECSPCFKRECPLGHFHCMKQLEPDRVLSALDQF